MLKRQQMGEHMFESAEVETAIGVSAAAHPDRPASTWELLRSLLADASTVPKNDPEPAKTRCNLPLASE
jgi:hypothetical protein